MAELTQVVAAIQVALRILAARWLVSLSLIVACVLFGWVMIAATWLHFTAAATFAVLVFLPVLWSSHVPTGDKADGKQG